MSTDLLLDAADEIRAFLQQFGEVAARLSEQAEASDPVNGGRIATRAQWIAAVAMAEVARHCAMVDGVGPEIERAGLAVAKKLLDEDPMEQFRRMLDGEPPSPPERSRT